MMSADGSTLSPIRFTFEYLGHGWAHASISDDLTTYSMPYTSYIVDDPLYVLVAALITVLRFGGAAGCNWFHAPHADRWTLRRADGALHITIRHFFDKGIVTQERPTDDRGDVVFSTTCDVWKFAAKVRLAASRMTEVEGDSHDPSWVQRTEDYRALCRFLEEHKRAQRLPSSERRKR